MSRTSSPAPQAASAQRGAAGPLTIARAPVFRETVAPANDALEHEADRIAEAVLQGRRWHRPGQGGWSAASAPDGEGAPIRRSLKATGSEASVAPVVPAQANAPEPGARPASSPLLVADDAEVTRGQMRKSEFMAALRSGICMAVDTALAGTGRDSQGCPWIAHWLGYYEGRSASEIERALHRYAPEAAGASTATQYVSAVAARVSRSAQRWARTGEVTGVPDEIPGAPLGGLLGGIGAMLFKARSGGARAADPVSVRDALGDGESLDGGLRGRMEGAFGAHFAAVRVHTDGAAARLSDQLHARAFAVGPHIAFSGGEFQPGTPEGDALIAHELAHVVQQGHAGASPLPESENEPGSQQDVASSALEHDADRSAASATMTLWAAPGSSSGIQRHVRPRIRSGLSLQRCAGGQKTAAGPQASAKLTPLQERQQSLAQAGENLRNVNDWVSGRPKLQGVPTILGVHDLDPAKADKVATAIDALQKANSTFGAKALDELPAKLDKMLADLKSANKFDISSGGDALDQRYARATAQHAVNEAVEASNDVNATVARLGETLDVGEIKKRADAISAALENVQKNPGALDGVFGDIKTNVREIKKQISEIRIRTSQTPKAIERILFVLRNFLALNAPGRGKRPGDDEIKGYMSGPQGDLANDFNIVFGEGKETHGFDVFATYADVLEKQLAVRAKMAQAKVDAEPIPTQGNAEDYFRSITSKKNDEVFAAYANYASAFFFHGEVATLGDMNVVDVSELYTTRLSVFGVRRLVCTGYALLGAHLLVQAGASLREFVVAVRATNDDIDGNKIDEGHALAHLTRQGKHFWVSNHLVVMSENDGIGPNAVAWNKKDAPLHKRSGATLQAANQALADALSMIARRHPQPGARRR
jgi:hypothetical protein